MGFGKLKAGKALLPCQCKEPVQNRPRQPSPALLGGGEFQPNFGLAAIPAKVLADELGGGKIQPNLGLAAIATQTLADELGDEGRGCCFHLGLPSTSGEQRPQKVRLRTESRRLHRRALIGVAAIRHDLAHQMLPDGG